ncbi:MAG TPA: cytochrome c [Candidatus Acidoferrales bacterium]|nr:cytochrome c [Candidatus Acidoferrales bacterium]
MARQPRYDPLEPSAFFDDGQSARLPVPGTVARGQLRQDEHFYQGLSRGAPATTFPFPIDMKTLERGRDRFDIFCSPCHDRTGGGDGMVVQRGFTRPPPLFSEQVRRRPPGHIYQVIAKGFGAMPDYAAQIPPADRWAIVAYVRALQLSQNVSVGQLSPEEREKLKEAAR